MNAGARLTGAATGVALAAVPLLRRARPDIARALAVRRRSTAELVAWGRSREAGPLVWLHGASAGELLGAAPAIRRLRGSPSGSRAGARAQLVVTHGSPSGRAVLAWLDPDYASPPPLDRARDCDAALGAVRPGLLVFAKLDVWPGLVAAAGRARVPVALINGTVRDGSRRSGALARRLFRASYARLDAVGAATPEDARRLHEQLAGRRNSVFGSGCGRVPPKLGRNGFHNVGFIMHWARAGRAAGVVQRSSWALF